MDANSDNGTDTATSKTEPNKPTPDNFDDYLPWACGQLGVERFVDIITTVISDFHPKVPKSVGKSKTNLRAKAKPSTKTETATAVDSDLNVSAPFGVIEPDNNENIKIHTAYDGDGNLVKLKFEKNYHIPARILKIIGFIVQFHTHLTIVTACKGIDNAFLFELNNLLSMSNITEICLDNTTVPEGSYEIFFEKVNCLKNLSLARCALGDDTVNKIASKLIHPQPASLTLSLLNLASNLITDIGAKGLATALRSNRHLCYLNLSDNSITDDGAMEILNVLGEFLLLQEEILSSRSRHLQYNKEKTNLIAQIMKELRTLDFDKRATKKKPKVGPGSSANSQRKGDQSRQDDKSMSNLEALWLEKAEVIAENRLGDFFEPFSETAIKNIDGTSYCTGNTQLAYLNLSYNSIGYISLKKIVSVLLYQKSWVKKPRGLVKIGIEGNHLPVGCKELDQLNAHFASLTGLNRKSSVIRKK